MRFSSHAAKTDAEKYVFRSSLSSPHAVPSCVITTAKRAGMAAGAKEGQRAARELENRSRGANNGRVDFLVCTSSSCRLSDYTTTDRICLITLGCVRKMKRSAEALCTHIKINKCKYASQNRPPPNLRALFCLRGGTRPCSLG